MGIARSSILRGPGHVALGSNVFHTTNGFSAELVKERFEIDTDTEGVLDHRMRDRRVELAYTPAGKLSAAFLTALHPHQTPVIGASLFGAADVAAYAHSKAGKKLTLHSAAIVRCPDLFLGATKKLFGPATIAAITKSGADPEDAGSLYTIATTAYTEPALASADVKTEVFAAAWGSILASIIANDGWTITTELGIEYHTPSDFGTLDAILTSVGVMAKCRPMNLSEDDIWDAMVVQNDADAAIGSSLRSGSDLVINSSSLTVTLKDAALVEGPLRWGKTELRAGEIGFIAHRAESAGAYGALYTLAV